MLTNFRKVIILLIFHIGWGFALWLSISKYGLGVSTDATSYMTTGVNWINGQGLIDYSGYQYILWPPLYPMLIGFLHLTGLSAFASAHVIQFVAYALLAYFSSIFFVKLFPDDFFFVLLGVFLLQTGSIVIPSFDMVGTDYLFSLFPVISALLINEYAEKQKMTTLTLLALTASLAMLTRYLGYVFIITALMSVLYYTNGTILKRILHAVWVGIFSIPPFLWMAKTWLDTAGRHNAPLLFKEYFAQFTVGLMAWFVTDPPRLKDLAVMHYIIVWTPIACVVILMFVLLRKTRVVSPLIVSSLGFGTLYMFALFGTALISYFNHLWGRFQLPIYFPLIVLFLIVASFGASHLRKANTYEYHPLVIIGFVFFALMSVLQLNITLGLMRRAHGGVIPENSINTREMNKNSIIKYWKENPPAGEFRLLSNYTALTAFYTKQRTLPSPRKSNANSDEIIYPLEDYVNYLFPDKKDVYILWIEPNTYEHVYLPYELAPIAQIEVIIENEDGGIYLLRPAR